MQDPKSEQLKTRILNAHMLCLVYLKLGEFGRIQKFVEGEIKELLERLMDKNMRERDVQNHVLHIQQILADGLMMEDQYKKSSRVFYNISKYYNYWKVRKVSTAGHVAAPLKYEFGVDEYIRAKASYAECLMNVG